MQFHNRQSHAFAMTAAAFFGATFFGFFYSLFREPALSSFLAYLTILASYHILMHRYVKRRDIVSREFPQSWENRLLQITFYQNLDESQRFRFRQMVQIFLSEQRIVGIKPVEITDDIRILVAAGAVSLIFFRPEWEYRTFREILIYEDAFDLETFEISHDKNILGMVGKQIPIILSLKHLEAGFRHNGDGFNVAYHEFAHIIDLHDVGTESNPLHGIFARTLIAREMKKILKGQSVLREYGAQNESEFFAVVTEFFYERPCILKEHHPELYETLSKIYNFDPCKLQFQTPMTFSIRHMDPN